MRRISPQPNLIIDLLPKRRLCLDELIKGEEADKRGLFMVGMEVDDMDAEMANLKSNKVELTRGLFGAPGGPRIAFLEGPDGVEIELIELKE